MSDTVKIATRESYGNALVELGKVNEKVYVLDADLAGATKTGIFKKAFPDRHIDCGIAECNMMGIAAGLSTTGLIPFCSSFAMFASGRAFEQVRNSIGYPHLNVKIGATHAGVTVGEDGASHQCNEDLAVMRTIPGMVVICPSDDIEVKAEAKIAATLGKTAMMAAVLMAAPKAVPQALRAFSPKRNGASPMTPIRRPTNKPTKIIAAIKLGIELTGLYSVTSLKGQNHSQ